MKKFIFILTLLIALTNDLCSQLTFTISNPNGNYTITCSHTVIPLYTATNYPSSQVSFTWTNSQSAPIFSPAINATTSGIYTVTCSAGTLVTTQTLAILVNTTVPTLWLSATSTVITCYQPTVILTATSSAINPFYDWQPNFGIQIPSDTFVAAMPGTYSLTLYDSNNGCTNFQTINISDIRNYPYLNLPSLYTVSCPNGTVALSPNSITGANLTYSWSYPTPAQINGVNTPTLITNYPGQYTLLVTNTVNGCATQGQVNIFACVGIEEQLQIRNVLKIYPTPANNKLFVDSNYNVKIEKLTIINAFGQVVLSVLYPEIKQEVDISSLAHGVYFLKAENLRGQSLFKVVKD